MKYLKFGLSFLIASPLLLFGTTTATEGNTGSFMPTIIYDDEEMPYMALPEFSVFAPMQFTSKKQEKFYWKTVRDVKRTLPYAKTAAKIMKETDLQLLKIANEKEQKAYMKLREKELFDQFEAELRKLTFSQGRLLIRLVDRECDKTTFEIIKSYRGGFSAVFWQGIARIFGANLKSEFYDSDEDKIIERVIAMVEAGAL